MMRDKLDAKCGFALFGWTIGWAVVFFPAVWIAASLCALLWCLMAHGDEPFRTIVGAAAADGVELAVWIVGWGAALFLLSEVVRRLRRS